MDAEIPEELIETAYHLTESAWQMKHPDIAMKVARALLTERLAATERAAKIAWNLINEYYDEYDPRMPYDLGERVEAAIRSQP